MSDEDVSDFPQSIFRTTEVANAGKTIAADNVLLGIQVPDDVRQAFLIANNWRDAHAYRTWKCQSTRARTESTPTAQVMVDSWLFLGIPPDRDAYPLARLGPAPVRRNVAWIGGYAPRGSLFKFGGRIRLTVVRRRPPFRP